MERRNDGTKERWNIGTMEQWNDGTMEHWNEGTMEHWNIGTMEQWNDGTLETGIGWRLRTQYHTLLSSPNKNSRIVEDYLTLHHAQKIKKSQVSRI